jgi:hypothetical protein
MSELPNPDYARNMRRVGHCAKGGRPGGMQITALDPIRPPAIPDQLRFGFERFVSALP